MKKNILLLIILIMTFFVGKIDTRAMSLEEAIYYPAATSKLKVPESYPICGYEIKVGDWAAYSYIGLSYSGTWQGGIFSLVNDITVFDILDLNFNPSEVQYKLNKNHLVADFNDQSLEVYISDEAFKEITENHKCPARSLVDFDGVQEVCFDNGTKDSGTKCDHENSRFADEGSTSKLIVNNEHMIELMGINYKNSCDYNTNQNKYKACRYNSTNYEAEDIILLYNQNEQYVSINSKETNGERLIQSNKKQYCTKYDLRNFYPVQPDMFQCMGYRIELKIDTSLNECPSELYLHKNNDIIMINTSANSGWSEGAKETRKFTRMNCGENVPSPAPGPETCQDLISDKLREYINLALSIIGIGVPILLIGLIIYDFAMGVFAGSDDKVKKAKDRAIKRVVIAIVIFFVPTFINLVFDLVNEIWNKNYEICETKK